MADDGIRIDDLPPSGFTLADFVIAAMHEGATYQLSLAQVLELVTGAAPGQLDTLAELAAAIANDDDFAATMTAALAGKADAASTAAAIALKADATALTAGLATKINTADIATLTQILAGTAGKVLTADVVASRKGESAWINLNGLAATTFSGLPSNVTRMAARFRGVSMNTAAQILLRLGTSGGIVSTAYESGSVGVSTGSSAHVDGPTGFVMRVDDAARFASGHFLLERESSGDWYVSGNSRTVDIVGTFTYGRRGDLGGTLTQVQFLTSAGLFDAGQVKLEWEARL